MSSGFIEGCTMILFFTVFAFGYLYAEHLYRMPVPSQSEADAKGWNNLLSTVESAREDFS